MTAPTRYFTGTPCKRGHVSERWTASRACVECQKVHRTKNKAKHRQQCNAAQRARHQKNPEIRRAAEQKRYVKNPDRKIKRVMAWQAANRERYLASRRARQRADYREDRKHEVLRASKIQATKAGVPHELSYEDVLALWPKNNACPIFSDEFFSDNAADTEPELVRIDLASGFTKDNVLVLTKRAAALRSGVKGATELQAISDWLRCLSRS